MSENHTHFHMASKVIFQTLWKYTKTWRSLRSIFAYFFWWWKEVAARITSRVLDRSLNNFGRRMIRGWRWWRWFNYLWHGLGLFSAGHRLIQVGDGSTDFDDMRVGGRGRRRQSLFLRTFFDGIFGHASTTAIHGDHRCWRLAGWRWLGGSRRPWWGGEGGSRCSLTQRRRWCLGAVFKRE